MVEEVLSWLALKQETSRFINLKEVVAFIKNNTNISHESQMIRELEKLASMIDSDIDITFVIQQVQMFHDMERGFRFCKKIDQEVELMVCFFGCDFGEMLFCHFPATHAQQKCSKWNKYTSQSIEELCWSQDGLRDKLYRMMNDMDGTRFEALLLFLNTCDAEKRLKLLEILEKSGEFESFLDKLADEYKKFEQRMGEI